MSASDVFDLFSRVGSLIGLPAVTLYLIRSRRKERAEARREEAAAEVDEKTVGNRVTTSSITTLEAEIAALQRAFDVSRATDADTIARLRADIAEERRSSAEKDARIRELEQKVQTLQGRVAEVSDELARVSIELASLHGRD